MNTLFRYIHCRVYAFFKGRGDGISEFTATLVLSLMQFLTIINIIFLVQLIYDFTTPSKFAFLPLLIGIGIINWYQFERNFDPENVASLLKEETLDVRIRNGWLITIYLIISLLFPITLGILDSQ